MRILHVIPNLHKGGAQRLAIDICNELTKIDKVECKLLVLSESKNEFDYCSSNIQIIYCTVKFKLSFLEEIPSKLMNMKKSSMNLILKLYIHTYILQN